MGTYEDTMPIAASLNIPASKIIQVCKKNRDAFKLWVGQKYSDRLYLEIGEIIIKSGSLLNAGDYIAIATQTGCTIEQAEMAVKEIMAGFDYLDNAGLLDD